MGKSHAPRPCDRTSNTQCNTVTHVQTHPSRGAGLVAAGAKLVRARARARAPARRGIAAATAGRSRFFGWHTCRNSAPTPIPRNRTSHIRFRTAQDHACSLTGLEIGTRERRNITRLDTPAGRTRVAPAHLVTPPVAHEPHISAPRKQGVSTAPWTAPKLKGQRAIGPVTRLSSSHQKRALYI